MRQFIVTQFSLLIIITTLSFTQQSGWEWQNPLPQGNGIYDLWRFNDNHFLFVGNAGTIVETTDGGNTWDYRYHIAGVATHLRRVLFITNLQGWIVGDSGLVMTTVDGGHNWKILRQGGRLSAQNIIMDSNNNLWLCGYISPASYFVPDSGFILRSSDFGVSWQEVFRHSTSIFDIAIITDSVFWAASWSGILVSNDQGTTWEPMEPDTLQYVTSMYKFSSDTIWVTGSRYVAKTCDRGLTWTVYDTVKKISPYTIFFSDRDHGFTVGGSDYSLNYYTTNGGATWNEYDLGIGAYVNYRIKVFENGDGFIAGRAGIIHRTKDYGATWNRISTGSTSELLGIDFIDETHGWAVGAGSYISTGQIMRTTDGGNNWITAKDSIPAKMINVQFVSPDIGWATGFYAFMKTTDGGLTWNDVVYPDSIVPFSIYFLDSLNGWVGAGSMKTLMKTTDGGKSWRWLYGPEYNVRRIQFLNSSTGWLLDEFSTSGIDSNLMKTTDGGETWKRISVGTTSGRLRTFHFISEDIGWAAGNSDGIWKTTDGGSSWIQQHDGTSPAILNIHAVSPLTCYTVSVKLYGGSIILKTTDGGANWFEVAIPSTNTLLGIDFISENEGWVTGDNGTILKTTSGGLATSVDEPEERKSYQLPSNMSLQQNYPNPFNPTTTLKYDVAKLGNVILKVYDVLGREVATLVNEIKVPGKYSVQWNSTGKPSGIYFYRLIAGNYSQTKKMVLLR